MSYRREVLEYAKLRYEQELSRVERSGNLRVFYVGLLGTLAGFASSIVDKHGFCIAWNGTDIAFWVLTICVGIGCVITAWNLFKSIQPRAFGYFPLPDQVRKYAENSFEYYHALGVKDADERVEDDLLGVLSKRIEEVTINNFSANTDRASYTNRSFKWLCGTMVLTVLMYFISLLISSPDTIYNVKIIGASP